MVPCIVIGCCWAIGLFGNKFLLIQKKKKKTSDKACDFQPISLRHQALKTFAIYPSDRARVSRQSVAIFLFFFFFFFFFFFTSFYFGRHNDLLFMGVLNLLKVVNDTRSSFWLGSFLAY